MQKIVRFYAKNGMATLHTSTPIVTSLLLNLVTELDHYITLWSFQNTKTQNICSNADQTGFNCFLVYINPIYF